MLYRVEVLTVLMVEANDEFDAEAVAEDNLAGEVANGTSEVTFVQRIHRSDQMMLDERQSLPWGSPDRPRRLTCSELVDGSERGQ